MNPGWLPASVRSLQDYSARTLLHDVVAGVTVGLVALPLAMAFAIASRLEAEKRRHGLRQDMFNSCVFWSQDCKISGHVDAR